MTRWLVCCAALFALPVSAQSRCEYRGYGEDGEVVFYTAFTFDGAGRIASIDSTNEAAAYSTTTALRYDEAGDLVEERVVVHEGPDDDELGPAPPTTVTTARERGRVTVRPSGARTELSPRQVWEFDERGLPTRLERTPSEYGGSAPEVRTCVYDLAGRPVYQGAFQGAELRNERRWIWSGDTLERVEASWTPAHAPSGSETRRVRRRGDRIEVVGEDGLIESWTGRCDALLYGLCSPLHAPPPEPGRARAVLPPSRGAPVRPSGGRAIAFPEHVLATPLTLRSLRAGYPAREVWTTVSFYENAPDVPYALVCIGRRGRCLTILEHDAAGRARRVDTRDPGLVGPSRVRVGASYSRVRRRLEACERRDGLEQGIACRVRTAPHVEAWFDLPEDAGDAPVDALLARGRVVRLVWAPPGPGS